MIFPSGKEQLRQLRSSVDRLEHGHAQLIASNGQLMIEHDRHRHRMERRQSAIVFALGVMLCCIWLIAIKTRNEN